MSEAVVGTRSPVSSCATEEVAESRIPVSSCSTVEVAETQTSNTDKPSPQFLDPKSKFPNPSSNPSAGNASADHPEIIQKMQKLQMPFIANEGQVDESVAFYARTFGGTVFVTKNGEIVYSLPSGRDVPAGASQESGRGWRQGVCRDALHASLYGVCRDALHASLYYVGQGSREAEGQGFEGCAPDGRLMGLRVADSTRGRDTARRVPTSPIQYLAYVMHSAKGDVVGGVEEKRESRIMDYVSWFGDCVSDGRLMGLRATDSTKGRDTVPRVPTVNLCEDTAGRVAATVARRDTASRVPGVALKEEFVGARVLGIRGEGESVTKVSCFKGNDPSKWRSNISTYEMVNLGEIYEGVELKLKAHGNTVEKLLYVKPGASPEQIKIRLSGIQPPVSTFINGAERTDAPAGTSLQDVKPGADPGQIKISLSGVNDCGVRNAECGIACPKSKFQNPKLQINNSGELVAETELGLVKFTKPVAYQEIDGKRVEVAVEYRIEERSEKHISHKDTKNTKEGIPGGMDKPCLSVPSAENEALKYENDVTCNFDGFDGSSSLNPSYPSQNPKSTTSDSPNPNSEFQNPKSEYCFTVASYDKTKDLIIDPLLASTFLGGSGSDNGTSLTIDTSGNVYVTGRTSSTDFPTTSGAYDTAYNSWNDVFVSKLDSGLASLLASTYLGGSSSHDEGCSLTLDINGNVYVTGNTWSTDFPTTSGAYDTSFNGGSYDVFVSKLDSGLTSLLASTFVGGSNGEKGSSLTLDTSGNVYVTGVTYSSDFPTTSGAYDTSFNGGECDVFVSKLNGGLTGMLASTFVGGSYGDWGNSIALDTSGNVYVTGGTDSIDFPTTSGAYDTSQNGGVYYSDVFISKLDGGLTGLQASTYLGAGSFDYGGSLALDTSGNVYVAGYTYSTSFPTTNGAYDTSFNGGYFDVFVSKLNSGLT
ncbi:MAG: hypothetical protein HW390_375, partial [Candidatus Brocadiaceae bacterium]|nr:hypothetical protein [Candidatus Brocadiaceae bacterium]